ncbi:hypothetical protein [Anaerobaca lacustris]|uniref:DUF4434 domain-containing protein n=1 Tax=Anaerobaca lacustris TaxID=3044600 RepID=A0AAW6TSN1_9BACT|nr:hypothetical protein [Sedimentisphaerales bacterium M17dextr]
MLRRVLVVAAWVAVANAASGQALLETARERASDLRLATYATSHQVERMATDADFRAAVWEAIERMGITKLYLEVYRGGHTVPPEQLIQVRDWLLERNISVVGGIATVPGGDVGVRQEGPLGWFNWQNEKTQRDLERIIRASAPIFDTFIVDDFLCTADVSAESERAKGDRSWGQYRRELLTELAQSIFLRPAREVHSGITMIVKYPQWYDRFHLFGYDTVTFPRLFDQVWVGTETRGRNTQRFGFVQPYEGFINYRWLAGIAGDKIGGAWFDHGDCAEHDFLDQAYTSVLAGAPELVMFNLGDVVAGHPDHAKVASQFGRLADLAAFVRQHPVTGVPAYKPPNSDPAGDMYLMDLIGMLGIPLVPVHEFPHDASVIFLPAQAAADPRLYERAEKARARGRHLILTTNLLIAWPQGRELASVVGIDPDLTSAPLRATYRSETGAVEIDLEAPIEVTPRTGDVVCADGTRQLLLLRTAGNVSLLNTHTYSQADFDAVGEVLLCPRPLGLLSLDEPALTAFRTAFAGGTPPAFSGPACVTYHPFADASQGDCVFQNFNDRAVEVSLTLPQDGVRRTFTIPPRERVWIASGEAR